MELIASKVIKQKHTVVFAIRKEVSNSGEVNYIPLCGTKMLWTTTFTRILKAYDEYYLLDLDVKVKLTQEQALEHIKGYIQQLNNDHKDDIQTIEILKLETDA
jgi:hypothetical protein